MGDVTARHFLVDTNAFIWMATEPERLPDAVHRQLADPRNRRFISTATTWELAIKHWKGKLPQVAGMMRGYGAVLNRLDVESIEIVDGHAIYAGALQWDHTDPFDRMIAAQAVIEGLPLVTADPAFSSFEPVQVVWN